ncbi:hypothetical protein AMAG_18039 [Allomyces macrogynus ATCC 38327]|uniref:Uncharacterized protein n=1 Tax=Allomyces macrogynus (strain ATCC 38327) TaxID=578462 RepID=A0A0L0S4L4_ALLM3|nr:hypothetical protein AMAG_18039 [Allomyces macrogynus ATCC 38327]|eukprot:KNE57319.1 hypothetical protein AMAG_18039 [Allomyces macrogynus ATCC 38327]
MCDPRDKHGCILRHIDGHLADFAVASMSHGMARPTIRLRPCRTQVPGGQAK